ncbi:MAG: dGTPase [Flavobacteriales bacterium CG_4_9_14_3_um_filter_40_17]|nr:MAG: dGTPase [Flavobacteriales bacterium CG_4_9_14_3_um_filter_40_17]
MKWDQLLSLKRFGDKHKRLRTEQDDTRLGFDVDYDRIVFSSPFRLLQDKTQVIPLSKTDFVHTRLTHSLEVSVVARSLGRIAGKKILVKHPYLKEVLGYQPNDFGSITASAALAHDIGNPPFGHSGEKAIGHFFSNGPGQVLKNQLTEAQWHDLTHFEGNANGLRILSRHGQEKGGLRLSYATLGAFIKYPKTSLPIKPTSHVADKKFGVFQTEKDFFEELASELGLGENQRNPNSFARHPLAYLVEAADDICYTLIDFEDGINLGWIPEEYALEYLVKLVAGQIDTQKYTGLQFLEERVAYLRAISINTLIQEAVRIFMENEAAILNGTFEQSLLDKSIFKAQMNDIISLSIRKIYQSREVLEKELGGFKIINDLLAVFVQSTVNQMEDKLNHYDKIVLKNLPEKLSQYSGSPFYNRLLDVCGYISMLTDSQAILLQKKINGQIEVG